MDNVMLIIWDYFPTSLPENDEEIIKILEGFKESLHDLDKGKIERDKKELMKFLKGVKK
jgi:prephenate dehydrogenase